MNLLEAQSVNLMAPLLVKYVDQGLIPPYTIVTPESRLKPKIAKYTFFIVLSVSSVSPMSIML